MTLPGCRQDDLELELGNTRRALRERTTELREQRHRVERLQLRVRRLAESRRFSRRYARRLESRIVDLQRQIEVLNRQRIEILRNSTPGYSPCLPIAEDYDCLGGGGDGPEYARRSYVIHGYDRYDL
jgi:predicted nuclease with TOPRIM domain